MMRTNQHEFHVMRGHVDDGTEIECDNGDVLTLHATMSGWKLVNQHGEVHGAPTSDAQLVARFVYEYGRM
jgi:hypothetical protein